MGLEPMGYTAANRRTIKLMVEQAAPLFEDGSAPMFMNMATAVIEVAVGKLFYAIAPIGDPNAGKKRLFLRVNTAPYYEDQGDAAAPGSQAQIDAAKADLASPLGASNIGTKDGRSAQQVAWAVRGVTPEQFGAAGTGAADDSTAFATAATAAMAWGVPLVLGGQYRVETISAIPVTGTLEVVAARGTKPVVNGATVLGDPAAPALFKIATGSFRAKDITFVNFTTGVLVGSDGLIQNIEGDTWAADIEEVSLVRCSFQACARAAYFENKTWAIGRLRLLGNEFDGRTLSKASVFALSGFHFDSSAIVSVNVQNNKVAWIDGTRRGYSATSGQPLRTGVGCGILVGYNNPEGQARQDAQNDWLISGNTVEEMSDSRNEVGGVSPILEGIRAVGARGARVTGNTVRNIRSANGFKDCSGIYVKIRWGIVAGNTLDNAGYSTEGAILIKGYTAANEDPGGNVDPAWTGCYGYSVIVRDNVLRTDYGDKTVAIGVQTSDVLVTGNRCEGFGGSSNVYVTIYTRGANLHKIHIIENTFVGCLGYAAVRTSHAGTDLRVNGNTIDGVDAAVWAGDSTHVFGITVENVDGNRPTQFPLTEVEIEGNRINGLVAKSSETTAREARAIQVYINVGTIGKVEIMRNKIRSQVGTGVIVGGAVSIASLVLRGNDFTKATRPYATTGAAAAPPLTADDNDGWMFYTASFSGGSGVAAGAYLDVTISTPGNTYGDFARLAFSNFLNGLSYTLLGWTSGNVFTFRLKNDTAASINLGTRTAYLTCEKRAS